MEWRSIFSPTPDVYIMGNPPFVGHQTKNVDQRGDLEHVWGAKTAGTLDYVTGWYKKAADYFQTEPAGQFAFVSTNSVAQGQSVKPLFQPMFEHGWRIFFAHRTFAWTSEAPGAAAVHVVIIGMEKGRETPARMFSYPHAGADATELPAKQINPYLLDAPTIWVGNRGRALGDLPSPSFGTMALDAGALIVKSEEFSDVSADPIAARYLRPYVGAQELIHDQPRWCLWLEDAGPQEIASSGVLRERVAQVSAFREGSVRSGDAYKYRQSPHLMRPNRSRPLGPYVCVPRVAGHERRFMTADHFGPETIASDAVFTLEDPDGFLFSLVSSSMFITWQRLVGGYVKSDPRFSKKIVWNNLPLPSVPKELRTQIIGAGKDVLAARALHKNRSLADHYNPLAMDPALISAHDKLDRAVDVAFGAKKPLASNEERQAVLFQRYLEMTAEDR